ncbi:putative type VI secretion system protein VgrGA [Pseudomonas reidholzensis]|uniref:Putative type VI secretion system protein VgrGA n=1 Tax=Pseudomonas reidholzensis TaxID=1785162 RepID=A0A383RXX2_9PSED|nr:type VI secretion system tip protein VgrG [Pseudomonas reidholzensis]SYX91950.1 putative type VI secretion system protein VgrGA [Pseudomonas reidholzensis]
MSTGLGCFFDHSQHQLKVRGLAASLDVLTFNGQEGLSQPFKYTVEFTSIAQDIAVEQMLGRDASFTLHAPPQKLPMLGFSLPPVKPLRALHGVITGLKRLSGSRDEARYEIVIEAHLALLGRGRQYRIYQHQSVPEIVESVLRSRHQFEGQHLLFQLVREYPRREQVMQYGESDLAFITRLLAEVGIWYRFTTDERLHIAVVEFHDDQRHYEFNVRLAYREQSGLSSSGQDAVWDLQTSHQVVDQHINVRAYHHRDARAYLDGEVDQSRGATTTYGEGYHYAEPYTALGDALDQDEDLLSESGYFYARLHHERFLNDQTRLGGVSSSAAISPGQVLKISDGPPQAFAPGAVITVLTLEAARDRSLVTRFEAIPYSETVCFRPPLGAKPQMAGTVPARVTSNRANDPYGHIDLEGRYRVSFLFDRDTWKAGEESVWLRLARPYAGDTHGLHLPLICGTEVAVAFEHGDPDRPYIAHALHDSQHPDHVTLRNYKRNVLRTPANNKLRMDDTRGQEHIKLSTEHGGKSQLNLGHLVDEERKQRGEGVELRTDGWGVVRAGKGILISADQQPKAQGAVLAMEPACTQLQAAAAQMADWQQYALAHNSRKPSLEGLQRYHIAAKDLHGPAMLLNAPQGIGAVTSASLLLRSGSACYLQSGEEINLAAGQRLSANAEQSISLLARQEGMRLVSLAEHLSGCVEAGNGGCLGLLRYYDPRLFPLLFSHVLSHEQQQNWLGPTVFWSWLDRDGIAQHLAGTAELPGQLGPFCPVELSDDQLDTLCCASDATLAIEQLAEAFPSDWGAERRFQACYSAMLDASKAGLFLDAQRTAYLQSRLPDA